MEENQAFIYKQASNSYLCRHAFLLQQNKVLPNVHLGIHHCGPQKKNSKVLILIWLLNCRLEGI